MSSVSKDTVPTPRCVARFDSAFRELMTALRREEDSIRDELGLQAEAG